MLGIDQLERPQERHGLQPLGVVDAEFEAVELPQHGHVLVAQSVVARLEVRAFNVAHAQAVAAGLVHVGWADALERTADLGLAFGGL